MKLQRSEVTAQFIMWRDRLLQDLAMIGRHGLAKSLAENFIDHLSLTHRRCSREDFEFAIKDVVTPYSRLYDWYGQVLERSGIQVQFNNCAPYIPQDRFTLWRRATTRIDGDALITLAFVRQYDRPPVSGDLHRWGVYATSADRDLERILARGVSDIHTHLEGCDPVPLLWLRLVAASTAKEPLRLDHFPEYHRVSNHSGIKDRFSLANLRDERDLVFQASGYRRRLVEILVPEMGKPTHFPSPVAAELWSERSLLGLAWWDLLHGKRAPELLKMLDHYLFAKNLFLARHIQTPWGNVGLKQFRSYFHRAKLLPRPATPNAVWRAQQRMVHFVSESRKLRNIEFRISPLSTAADFARAFKDWNHHVGRDPYLKERGIQVHFVVHFIRDASQNSDDLTPFARLRKRLDRESAALHLFRVKYPDLAKSLVGIDVASLERSCPPHIFTPYMRLLRGQERLEEQQQRLEQRGYGKFSPYLHHWQELQSRGLHLHPPRLPRLGFTFHAGEDYYHPLDGIRSMADVISGLNMGPGDRIGHGLAAGRSIRHFHQEYGESLYLPRGVALDNLVWIYHQLSHRVDSAGVDMRRLEERIEIISEEIYGMSVSPAQMIRVNEYRHEIPIPPQPRVPKDRARLIHYQELFDRSTWRRRAEIIRNPEVFHHLDREIELAQESLMQDIAKKGVVIEFNPSSNFVTGGMESLAHHPFFKYKETLKGNLRATINCDDPGTFGTRIENEFSCMLNALIARGTKREKALDLLEKMRKTGTESGFAWDPSTVDQQLFQTKPKLKKEKRDEVD